MPLLLAEPSVHPSDLFKETSFCPNDAVRWSALYVKARTEKALARKLLAQGISYFLPLYQQSWRTGGRMLRSYLPAFPGYVFLRADAEARLAVAKTNLVVRVLNVEDQSQLHADLARIHRLIEAGECLIPVDRLMPGTLVEITSGALAGMQGTVLHVGNKLRIVIDVRFIQQGVSLEIDRHMIRPVHQEIQRGN